TSWFPWRTIPVASRCALKALRKADKHLSEGASSATGHSQQSISIILPCAWNLHPFWFGRGTGPASPFRGIITTFAIFFPLH
ncbi:MAG: hypothetical protein KBA58_05000, partial [Methanomassiliicoccales archaeon]|nr:hypothetical protein [Methanomassiliicoccales archaeon]